ncbi:glycosyltransferase family 87 protein [Amycolatopsis anabasis]|uniref:glycosyltransferase family 87 protein n=1 Tax=Amycolatopsis anabasis TaxID=1840409 RepID=UPI00131ADCA0|nr:glycosyltransferase family 87 protein [Amycolatopsis anabasis]
MRTKWVTAVTAVAAVVAVFGAWWALRPALQAPLPTPANRPEERLQDFRDALYFPIRELLAGGNPYDPAAMFAHWPVRQAFNLYQPYHLALHLPFALPGYRVGAVLFTLFAMVLLVVLTAMAARRLRLQVLVPVIAGTAVLTAFLLLSQVGKAQLFVGQVNPLLAVGAAGVLLARRDHPRWAAVALGLAWLKPQVGLPLSVLLLARGSGRVVAGGTAIAAAASLPVVVLLIARGGLSSFVDAIVANVDNMRHTPYGAVDSPTAQRIDLAAVFFRVTGVNVPGAEIPALLAVLAVSVVLVRRLDRLGDPDSGAVADLLTFLAVFTAIVHQPGDVLYAFPATVVAAAVWWRRRRDPGWTAFGLAVLALLVPYLHLYAADDAIRSVLGDRAAVTVDGVAVVLCWGLLAAFAVRLTRRVPEPVP